MKSVLTLILFGILSTGLAQKGPIDRFKLPLEATQASYVQGVVLVKAKSGAKEVLMQAGANNRVRQVHPDISGVALLMPINSTLPSARQSVGNTTSGIDLGEYFKIFFQGTDIENFINELYATGLFDIVEPDYVNEMHYVPNDPDRDFQSYLDIIKAYDAWDISKSNKDIIIAIIDSGGDLAHPDLKDKLFVNEAEMNGLPGVDDDGNGFIDDINGWDFSGAETSLINTPGFVGDNDPAIYAGGNHSHGTWAAGIAAASTDNGVGIAGIGFNAKLLFTKHFADNQPEDARGYSSDLYQGVLYAAAMGAKVINCSFGSPFRSQIRQNIVTAVTLDYGCLVVASAGNASTEAPNYPASYENVISVAATTADDLKSTFSTYNFFVDISAPGTGIYTTSYGNEYFSVSGTSFSGPMVAGAAALLWSHYPDYTPEQIAQQLRVSADESIYAKNSISFKNRLGKGRLNILRALTEELPSIKASKFRLVNDNGTLAFPGQNAKLILDFKNILKPSTSALKVALESSNPLVTVTKSSVQLGVINQGQVISNANDPFELTLSSFMPPNFTVNLVLTYTDGAYTDYDILPITFNTTYLNVEENLMSTTLSEGGRIGYDNPSGQDGGLGVVFNENQLLYEMGIIMGTGSDNIQSNVRGATGAPFDQDFTVVDKINQIRPGERSSSEVFGKIRTTTGQPSAEVTFRSLVWGSVPDDKFMIMEYKIRNLSDAPIQNFYFGLFADWDVSDNGATDRAALYKDSEGKVKVGYVFPVTSEEPRGVGGIQPLTNLDVARHFAIENNPSDAAGAGSFGLYDGYLKDEKFTSISNSRERAGFGVTGGTDVSHVVSNGPFNIPQGGEITLAYAIHAAEDSTELIRSAERAFLVYNRAFTIAKPVANDVETCYGGNAEILVSGGTNFKWYNTFTGGESLHEGNSLLLGPLFNDTIVYVANADNEIESIRTAVKVLLKANPTITSSGSTTLCDGQTLTLSVAEADSYLWNTGATTRTIDVKTVGNYSVRVRSTALGCESTSQSVLVNVIPSPTADFISSELVSNKSTSFTDKSQGAVAWSWEFGDGGRSTVQNPTYQFRSAGNTTVKLTVTSANGCTATVSRSLNVITSVSKNIEGLKVYPNPVTGNVLFVETAQGRAVQVELATILGQTVSKSQLTLNGENQVHQIDVSNLKSGLYLLITTDSEGIKQTSKIVISH